MMQRIQVGIVVMMLTLSARPVLGQTLYWDPNGLGAGIGGDGAWTGSDRFWAPDANGTQCIGQIFPACLGSNALVWPTLTTPTSAVAVFAGVPGTMTLSQSVAAAGLRFEVDGYQLIGAGLTLSDAVTGTGTLTIAAGATMRSSAPIGSTLGKSVVLDGPGTFVAAGTSGAALMTGNWLLQSGTLRLENPTAAATSFLVLASGTRLEFDGATSFGVGRINQQGGQSIVLGDRSLAVGTAPGAASFVNQIGGRIEGSNASRVTLTNSMLRTDAGASMDVGSLQIANSALVSLYGDARLTSLGSSLTSSTPSSLRVTTGGRLVVAAGGSLTAYANPQIEDSATFTIEAGGQARVLRPDGGFGTLRVGFANNPGTLVDTQVSVSGKLFVDDNIALGGTIGSVRGRGALSVAGGGVATAPVLSFVEPNSSLNLGLGGTARFAVFDPRAEFNQPGTIRFDGGTLEIGDRSLTSTLLTSGYTSSFAGRITGSSGTLRVLGESLDIRQANVDFSGLVRLDRGLLRVYESTLQYARLDASGGGILFPDARSGQFTAMFVGALEGTFDFGATGIDWVLGGGNHTSTWNGRFMFGPSAPATAAGLIKVGTGTQIFDRTGATDVFEMNRLDVQHGTAVLRGGTFRFLNEIDGPANGLNSLFVAFPDAMLRIDAGARVEAMNRVATHNGSVLLVEGAGTRLDVLPSANGLAVLNVGRFGSGSMRVENGALVNATHLLLGRDGEPASDASLTVRSNATVTLGLLQFQSDRTSVLVDGGQVRAGNLFVLNHNTFVGSIKLSDAADGTPALVLGSTTDSQGTLLFGFPGSFMDSASGPGSIRKIGAATLPLLRDLDITGRVIVDGGRLRPTTGLELRNVTLVNNVDDGVDLSALPASGSPTLSLGGLSGGGRLNLGNADLAFRTSGAPRSATFSGALTAGVVSLIGAVEQRLSGASSLVNLYVSAGSMTFDGGVHTSSGVFVGGGSVTVQRGGVLELRRPGALSDLFVLSDVFVRDAGSIVRTDVAVADGGRITVDGGLLQVSNAFASNGRGQYSVSDLLPAIGADPTRALTGLRLGGGEYRGLPDAMFNLDIADGPSGPGGITFAPNAPTGVTMQLMGSLTYTGPTIVEGAGNRLVLVSPAASRSLIARDAGTFAFGGAPGAIIDLIGKHLLTDADGRFEYAGHTLLDGTLHGAGHKAGASGVTLDGTRVASSARLISEGSLTLQNATVSGHVIANAALWADASVVSASGHLDVRGAGAIRNATLDGRLSVADGGRLVVVSRTAAGVGARIDVAPTAEVTGDAFVLNGALLDNRGTMSTPIEIGLLGRAQGTGSFGAVQVNAGGTFAPGASPGAATAMDAMLGAGGRYEVEVADALGLAGVGFDQWRVERTATFDAGVTPTARFTIALLSFGLSDLATNFDASRSYRWVVLRAGRFDDFTPDELVLDTSGWKNALAGGSFGLDVVRGTGYDELVIMFAPVPEPAAWVVMACGGVLVAFTVRRRRMRSRP